MVQELRLAYYFLYTCVSPCYCVYEHMNRHKHVYVCIYMITNTGKYKRTYKRQKKKTGAGTERAARKTHPAHWWQNNFKLEIWCYFQCFYGLVCAYCRSERSCSLDFSLFISLSPPPSSHTCACVLSSSLVFFCSFSFSCSFSCSFSLPLCLFRCLSHTQVHSFQPLTHFRSFSYSLPRSLPLRPYHHPLFIHAPTPAPFSLRECVCVM